MLAQSIRRSASSRRSPNKLFTLMLTAGLLATASQSSADVSSAPAKVPPFFETNKGQADSWAQFLSRGPHATVFLAEGEAMVATSDRADSLSATRSPRSRAGAVLRLRLLGATAHPEAVAGNHLAADINYYIGRDPHRWHLHVPAYTRVEYRNVYPGVDVLYYYSRSRLEHDFIVQPGACPGPIAVRLDGTRRARLDSRGNVRMQTAIGHALLHRPTAYQDLDGTRSLVTVSYLVAKDGSVRFALGPYVASRPLVIDPILDFATYL